MVPEHNENIIGGIIIFGVRAFKLSPTVKLSSDTDNENRSILVILLILG